MLDEFTEIALVDVVHLWGCRRFFNTLAVLVHPKLLAVALLAAGNPNMGSVGIHIDSLISGGIQFEFLFRACFLSLVSAAAISVQ